MIDYETLEEVTLFGFAESLEFDLAAKNFIEENETGSLFPVLSDEEDCVAEALYAGALGLS